MKHSQVRWLAGLCLFVVAATLSTVVLADSIFSVSGDITSEAQYDLYTRSLKRGDHVVATLICDEIAPNDRPLDPYLSVFFPGSNPDSLPSANLTNDDGFGLDDDPDGVDCNFFDSSRIIFTVPADGEYTFRVDGFGTSTGPYTLTIRVTSGPEEPQWFEPGDDRINRQAYATASIYCDADNSRVLILGINRAGVGVEVLSVPYAELPPTPTGANVLIAQHGNVAFYRLTSGEYQVNTGPDREGKTYVVVWNGCPLAYQNAYILQNGVMTQTEANVR